MWLHQIVGAISESRWSGIGRDLYGSSIALTIRSLDPSLSTQLIPRATCNTHAPFLDS